MIKSKLRRALLYGLSAALPWAIGTAAQAQENYPNKPITLLVGSAPGGSNDTFARALAKRLEESWGQSVIVDNRPAVGGVLANAMVAKANPDGYTLVVLSSTFTTVAAIQKNLQYDAYNDFAPVAMMAKGPLFLAVGPDAPFKDVQGLVDYAQKNPGKVNYGTSGVGSILNFATEHFISAANVKMSHVPYKSGAPALTDLMGGHIQMMIGSIPSFAGPAKAGKIRMLAVTSAKRFPTYPELPSLEELGYKGSAVEVWWGVLAPAGTPEPIVEKLNAEISKIIHTDSMKEFLLQESAEPASMKPAEFASYIKQEIDRWKGVVETKGIQSQ